MINKNELPKSDPIGLVGNDAINRLPKQDNKPFLHQVNNTREHTYNFNSNDLKVKALFDYWSFVDLIGLQGGTEGFDPKFHYELSSFVTQTQLISTDIRRRIGLVPRGHAKTTLGSVGYALWRIYRNPNIRIIIATATRPLATMIIRQIKQYLESEELQESIWNDRPHIPGKLIPVLDKAGNSRRNRKWDLGDYTEAEDKKVVWRADSLQVIRDKIMKEPTLIVASPKSNITGVHCDLVIMDDIINDDTVATPEKREKTLEWTRDLESIVDPENTQAMGEINKYKFYEKVGQEFVIWGTRYHLEDYYQHVLDNKDLLGYRLMYRNIFNNFTDDKDGYLWESRFNKDIIERIKISQGNVRFSSQYLNVVRANEEVIFDRSKIQYFNPNAIIQDERKPGYAKVRIKDDTHYVKLKLVIDPAISQKKEADYTCIAVGGMDSNKNMYVVDYVYGKWLPVELIKNTYELMDKWMLTSCHIETVAYQAAIIPMFRENFHKYRPISLVPYQPKGEKQGRIEMYLQPLFENSMLYLHSKAKFDKEVQNEIEYFPTVHDDILDSFAILAEVCNPMSKKKDDGRVHHYLGGKMYPEGSYLRHPRYGGRIR